MVKIKQKDTSFEGKVVLVTGAASGIGRAAALAFGRAGASVVVADTSVDGARHSPSRLQGSLHSELPRPSLGRGW